MFYSDNIRADAKKAVINDYHNLRHPTGIINGKETELFIDSDDGDEEEFGKKLDAVFENLGQKSNTLLDDINNTREILYKLRSDAKDIKDINDKIKNKQIEFDQTLKVKILDQDKLKTLNDNIEIFDTIASKFDTGKKQLGEVLDKKYLDNSFFTKTYTSRTSRNYFVLRENFKYYKDKIRTIKRDIIALYGGNENILVTEIDNTLQEIKKNQNLDLQTIKKADNSCNIF